MLSTDLESLKYTELQKLAKSVGIKANQKLDKLLKALKEHYTENEDGHQKNCTTSSSEKSASDKQSAQRNGRLGMISKAKSPSTKSPALFSPVPKVTAAQALRKATPSTPLSSKKSLIISTAAEAAKKLPTPTTPATREGSSGSDSKPTRKRRRTFELDEPTLSAQNTPSADGQSERVTRQRTSQTSTPTEHKEGPAAKRVRKNTYDKDSPVPADDSRQKQESSPGTRAMIDSMDANSSSAERKAMLMSALDKKVQSKVSASPAQNTTTQPSQIPRFMAFLANKNKTENQKPVTPGNKDWTKIHQKAFSKFDSLDVYLEKKQQRIQKLTGSAKRSAMTKSPRVNKAKIAKPVSKSQTQVKPFIPTVTSTRNLSFNFSKTPASKTPSTQNSATNGTLNQTMTKTPKTQVSVASARKSIGANRTTPFKFTGNSSTLNATMNSQKKTFDLKASLAKPLTWKPHTGKLQPLDFNMPPPTLPATKSSVQAPRMARASRQAMANKTRPTQAKDVRRAKQLDRRNNQKYVDMMKRRGLMA